MTTNGNGKRPLPDGWKWTTIGKITRPVEKVKPQDAPETRFDYLDISGIDNEQHAIADPKVYYGADAPSRARQSVKAGDVLFSTVRTYLKNIAQVPEKYDGQVASTGFAVLRGNDAVINKYLFYYSLTDAFLNPLNELQRGTSYPAVRDSDVREQPIPLAPLPVQERIVAEIEKQFTRLDTAVSTLNRLQNTLDRYQASLLKAACTGQLLPQDANDEPADRLLQRILAERRQRWLEAEWQNQVERAQKKTAQAQRKAAGRPHNIRDLDPADWQALPEAEYAPYLPQNDKWQKKYKEPAAVETADLPDLPRGWVWARIEQLSTLIQYGTSDKASVDNTGVPVLRMGNIQAGELDFGNLKYMPEDWGDIDKFLLEDGDLIFNRTNSAELVGKTAVYKKHHPKTTFASYLIRVQFANGVLPDFVSFYINSILGRMYIASVVSQQVGQANVNGTKLANMAVPLPPHAGQKRIVEEVERRLSIVTATQQAIRANQTRSGRLV